MLARRVSHIKPAPTLALSTKIDQLKVQGEDVVGFGAGEPDCDTPKLKAACERALWSGKTKYAPSAGLPELRQALARKLWEENSVEYRPSEIVVSSGAKMVLYLVFLTILDEGDEVLLPSPYWVTYPEQIMLCGAKPVVVPLNEDTGFVLTARILEPYISKRTKALVLNSPSNPTGAVIPRNELEEIAQLCVDRRIFIVSDECYEAFVYDGEEFVSPASLSREVWKITFTVNAFSKTYSMTGWRVGYVACPEKYAKMIADLNSQTISNVTTFAQYGALSALTDPRAKEFVKTMRETFSKRRNIAYELLKDIPHVSVVKPKGTFYIFPNLSYYSKKLGSDLVLADYLLEKGKVAGVPGSAFGAEGYLRLSYCVSEETIREGIWRIRTALESLE